MGKNERKETVGKPQNPGSEKKTCMLIFNMIFTFVRDTKKSEMTVEEIAQSRKIRNEITQDRVKR